MTDAAQIGTEAEEPELSPETLGTAPGRARLVGRRVIVVGAGTRPSEEPDPPPGNGRAIAVLAAREGAQVVCVDRDEAAAKQTVALIEAEGGWARALRADVSDEEQCAALVADSAQRLGGLDGLVLNVGIALGRGLTGTSAKDWDLTFAVNVRAHFLIAAAALPVLAPRSSVVFVSSAASLRAGTGGTVLRLVEGGAAGSGPADRPRGGPPAARGRTYWYPAMSTPRWDGPRRPQPGPGAPAAAGAPGHPVGGRVRRDLAALLRVQLPDRPVAGARRRDHQPPVAGRGAGATSSGPTRSGPTS